MDPRANRVFISYRRDDTAGYAGRLEEALERRLGRGSVFRDVLDIPPGADFAAAIRARLSQAHAVLVLIGPHWAGGGPSGTRRIDDAGDFVRLEVAAALDSGARVVPVLLPGVTMPAESDLPSPLKALAQRNAISLTDANWDADVSRLLDVVGPPRRSAIRRWALGCAALAVCAVALLVGLKSHSPGDPSLRLIGTWQAQVRYPWGDPCEERFEFLRHAGQLTGTATFLRVPRAIERMEFDGLNLRFETRTQQSMNEQTREVTHRYSAELQGKPPDEKLIVRMHSSGGFENNPPLQFEALRIARPASAATD